MIKECNKCINESNFKSGLLELNVLLQWIGSVNNLKGESAYNAINIRYSLFRCKDCGTFWEWRPLYEETIYGGEPGEWVKVSRDYVKEYYPDVKVD